MWIMCTRDSLHLSLRARTWSIRIRWRGRRRIRWRGWRRWDWTTFSYGRGSWKRRLWLWRLWRRSIKWIRLRRPTVIWRRAFKLWLRIRIRIQSWFQWVFTAYRGCTSIINRPTLIIWIRRIGRGKLTGRVSFSKPWIKFRWDTST